MTTIVNTPPASENANGTFGTVAAIVAVMVVAYMFIVFGLPVIQRMSTTTPTTVTVPVPNNIDVNIKKE